MIDEIRTEDCEAESCPLVLDTSRGQCNGRQRNTAVGLTEVPSQRWPSPYPGKNTAMSMYDVSMDSSPNARRLCRVRVVGRECGPDAPKTGRWRGSRTSLIDKPFLAITSTRHRAWAPNNHESPLNVDERKFKSQSYFSRLNNLVSGFCSLVALIETRSLHVKGEFVARHVVPLCAPRTDWRNMPRHRQSVVGGIPLPACQFPTTQSLTAASSKN